MRPVILSVSRVEDFQPVLSSHVDPVTKEVTVTTGPKQWRISCGAANIALVMSSKPDIKPGDQLILSKFVPAGPKEVFSKKKDHPL